MLAQSDSQTPQSSVSQYVSYPFATDQLYKEGLAAILANGALQNAANEEEKDEILRQTRVFYFNKITGNSITLEQAGEYERSLWKESIPQSEEVSTMPPPSAIALEPTALSQQAQSDEEPRILTFAEIKELIESGQLDQIPNNKTIPVGLNETPPSESTAQARKKPWESDSESVILDTFTLGSANGNQ